MNDGGKTGHPSFPDRSRNVDRRKATSMLLASIVSTEPYRFSSAKPTDGKHALAISKMKSPVGATKVAPVFGHCVVGKSMIAVKVIGGPLPFWAQSGDCSSPILEMALVRIDGQILNWLDPKPKMRIIFVESSITDLSLPDDPYLCVRCAGPDLDVVAEAVSRVMTGPSIIGIDLADIMEAASFRFRPMNNGNGNQNRGLGVVLIGHRAARPSVVAARTALKAASEQGFDGGRFVAVLIGDEQTAALREVKDSFISLLCDLSAFFNELSINDEHRPTMVTAFTDARCDAIVMVAFDGKDALAFPH